ncbi:MAG: HlyD family efflux transporter periplasmic adaptor subunit, partial [Chlorobiaceae bacterium]|nr:HlyD family efflux transporter periplasmic adaptor subunit [Chlorobiaceae bacterium]
MNKNPFIDEHAGEGEVYTQSRFLPRAILWVIVLSIVGAILWSCFARIDVTVPALGKLEPTGEVKNIQSSVDCNVAKLYIDDGQHVEKGAVLMDMVPVLSVGEESKLKSLQIDLANTRQQYGTESALLAKMRTLLSHAAVSEFEVEQKKLDVLKLQARIADLSEQIGKQTFMANQANGYEKLTTPVSGTVFDLQAKPGSVLRAGQVILKVVPDDQLTARAFISNQDIGFVQEG